MESLILGDIHLGAGLSLGKPAELGKLNSRIEDQVALLYWVLDLCKSRGIKNIFLTGDIYQDFRPHPTIIAIFMRWVKACENAGINMHIAMGNHDILRSGHYVVSALDLVSELELEKSFVYKSPTRIELEDHVVVMLPFRDKRMYEVATKEEALEKFVEEMKPCLAPTNKKKICIGHLALEGSLSIGNEITDHQNEIYIPTELLEWFDYVWMGHIHHPQVISEEKPYAAHIGSLDRSDFSKTEIDTDKIAIIFDTAFEEIVLPTRPLQHAKISIPPDKESTEFVINELCLLSKKANYNNAIVKLEITLNGPDVEYVNRPKIESYLFDNLGVFNVSDFLESRQNNTIQISEEDMFDNTMDLETTINKWAETRDFFENDEEREEFKKIAFEITEKYKEKLK
jgi:DNA repair exonuclease SbcCD nuclease subunit